MLDQMAIARRRRRVQTLRMASKVLFQIVVTMLALLFILPLFWLISSSLATNEELMRWPRSVLPEKFIWNNYPRIWARYPFTQWFKNTTFLALNAAIGSVVSNAFIAYGFSRIDWRGRDVLFLACLAAMMLPGAVTQIPVYIVWRKLGFLGTWLPLTLGVWLGSPYFTFLLVQFFRTIPEELSAAARVDGCSELGIFFRIMLPLCKPALAVIAFFSFTGAWNAVMGPLIYIKKRAMYTLALGVYLLKQQSSGGASSPTGSERTDWAGMMAASAIMAIPVMVLFYFTQNMFIEGITFTGMKG